MEQQTKKTKILVVDDEPDIVITLSTFLASSEGFKVYTATRPSQALEHVKNYQIDLAH
jgi:DNA-binding response OmpR family regulator